MKRYRIVKDLDGYYVIQKRFLFFFWVSIDVIVGYTLRYIHVSQAENKINELKDYEQGEKVVKEL